MAFNRVVEVLLGPAGSIGTLIKDLRISFKVIKTEKESTNSASIMIHNMDRNTANKVAVAKNKVILRAGYSDEGIANLFFGDITSVTISKDGTDRILEIKAHDGQYAIQNKNITVSYSAGTTKQKIFNDLVLAFGIPLANQSVVVSGQYSNGWAFAGKVKDALSELLESVNKNWSIQNEQLVVSGSNDVIQRTGLLISPDTGLIDMPESLSDQDEKQTENIDVPKRFRIKCLLFPQLFPNIELKLQSSTVNGTYKVESVSFTGDNYEGDFMSDVQVVSI